MLYQKRIEVSPVLEKICSVLTLSSRTVGDIVSSYALAHKMLAYHQSLSQIYKNVDVLAAEIEQQFQLLKMDGCLTAIAIKEPTICEEEIAFYRIEDSRFFLAQRAALN